MRIYRYSVPAESSNFTYKFESSMTRYGQVTRQYAFIICKILGSSIASIYNSCCELACVEVY